MTLQSARARSHQTQAARAVSGARARPAARRRTTSSRCTSTRSRSASAGRLPSSASRRPRACSSARTSATSRWPRRRPSPASSSRRRRSRRSTTPRVQASGATSCSQAMADAGFVDAGRGRRGRRRSRSPSSSARSKPKRRTSSTSSIQTLDEHYPGLTTTTNEAVDVYTTLDLHLQRLAQDAVRDGLTSVDKLLSRRKRKGRAEAALIAVDPEDRRHPRLGRRPVLQPVAVQPRRSRRAGSRDRSSSRSSTSRRSSRPPRKDAPT